MHQITKYVASDGSEWLDRAQAEAREELDQRVRRLHLLLGPRPCYGERFAVDSAVFANVKEECVLLCRRYWPDKAVFQQPAEKIHPNSHASRLLGDANCPPLLGLWYRLQCIADGYEYDQPYFAICPDQFKGVTRE